MFIHTFSSPHSHIVLPYCFYHQPSFLSPSSLPFSLPTNTLSLPPSPFSFFFLSTNSPLLLFLPPTRPPFLDPFSTHSPFLSLTRYGSQVAVWVWERVPQSSTGRKEGWVPDHRLAFLLESSGQRQMHQLGASVPELWVSLRRKKSRKVISKACCIKTIVSQCVYDTVD